MKYAQALRSALRLISGLLCVVLAMPLSVHAQPYGRGTYGTNVPYGSQTSLAISTSGDVIIQITPDDNAVLGTADNVITVTSTDVVGYSLYVRALSSSDMANGPAILPASSNTSPGTLATNTWGYNISGSGTNFVGMTTSNELMKTTSGPFTGGDVTTVKYGVKIDNTKPAGNYVTTVMYTAAPETD